MAGDTLTMADIVMAAALLIPVGVILLLSAAAIIEDLWPATRYLYRHRCRHCGHVDRESGSTNFMSSFFAPDRCPSCGEFRPFEIVAGRITREGWPWWRPGSEWKTDQRETG